MQIVRGQTTTASFKMYVVDKTNCRTTFHSAHSFHRPHLGTHESNYEQTTEMPANATHMCPVFQ